MWHGQDSYSSQETTKPILHFPQIQSEVVLLTPLGSQLLAGAQEEGQKPSCGHGAPWAPRGEKKDAALRNNPFQEHPYLGKVTPCLRTAGERAVTACRSTCPRHGSHPPPHTPIPRSGDSSQTLPHRHLHGLALGQPINVPSIQGTHDMLPPATPPLCPPPPALCSCPVSATPMLWWAGFSLHVKEASPRLGVNHFLIYH